MKFHKPVEKPDIVRNAKRRQPPYNREVGHDVNTGNHLMLVEDEETGLVRYMLLTVAGELKELGADDHLGWVGD